MIRPATTSDIPEILEMGRRFYGTTSYAGWADFDDGSVQALVEYLIKDGVLLVADIDGRLAGMVGLIVTPFAFNASLLSAHEVVWWVNPESQSAGVGKALLAAIEPACRERGCRSIQMICLASSPPQASAIYERHGYVSTESCFTKTLHGS